MRDMESMEQEDRQAKHRRTEANNRRIEEYLPGHWKEAEKDKIRKVEQ